MKKEIVLLFTATATAILAGCTTNMKSPDGGNRAPVAEVRLAEEEMTPVEIELIQDIPAGTELRLRQEPRLRPVWVGIFQITNITARGVSEPLALRDVPSFDDIRNNWGKYEKSGMMAIMKPATALHSGTKLTIRGHRYQGIDQLRQRYTGRETLVWLEHVNTSNIGNKPVSAPLIVRTASGPVSYLQAFRKADGRLLIQAFDKEDNPTDDAGILYTITGEDGKPLVVKATPGYEVTEISLPAYLTNSGAITVTDSASHSCRSSALPRTMGGRPIFFGDMHCHTEFSDGDYPTEDVVKWARYRIGMDFAGPGDHISQEGNFGDRTVADYVRYGQKYEEEERFCRIPAFETSCAGGHQLLCARDFATFEKVMADYVRKAGPRADMMDSAAYYSAMADIVSSGQAFLLPTHPIGHPNRWPDIKDKSRVCAVEIFHGGNSHEFHEADTNWLTLPGARSESSIRYALSQGYRLGFAGDSDNHRCLPGQSMVKFHGMTGVIADHLDTASVFDAIRSRHCYATSGARIVADATLNNESIGSEIRIAPDKPRTFKIAVHGTAPVIETQIIYCGNILKTFQAPRNAHDVMIEWTDSPESGRRIPANEYYFIRVRQTDGHAAWLSPFWVLAP